MGRWWASLSLFLVLSWAASGQEIAGSCPVPGVSNEDGCASSQIPGSSPSPPASSFRWTAGASLLVLVPRFESNPAYTATTTSTPLPGSVPLSEFRVQEFNYNFSLAPRVWVGFQTEEGFGARIRWFHFQQGARPLQVANPAVPSGSPVATSTISSASPILSLTIPSSFPAVNSTQVAGAPGSTDYLAFTNNLYFDVWDFEGTLSDVALGRWDFQLFGGLRYANLSQSYSAYLSGTIPQFLRSAQSFNGFGPTAGLEARRALGNLGLTAYGLARLSFLFGSDSHVSEGKTLGLMPPLILTANDDSSARQRMVPALEAEFGGEWARNLGPAQVFLQAGVLAQAWPIGSGANGNGVMGLLGFNVSSGLRF